MGWTYAAELIQTDPEDSPTPGAGHYAGELRGADLANVRSRAEALIGGPVPPEAFSPCCDWQDPKTPITGIYLLRVDEKGNTDEGWRVTA